MVNSIPPDTLDNFLAYVGKVYAIAIIDYPKVEDANLHTMEWLRVVKYSDYKFQILMAIPPQKFIDKVNAAGITRIDEFLDPTFNIGVGIPHMFCSMNGVYGDKGAPTFFDTNSGDVAGWGGDFTSFYAQWWQATLRIPRTGAFAGDVWAFTNAAGSPDKWDFHIKDWLEDADAFNIATILLQPQSLSLPDALQQYYKPSSRSGYKTRFEDFYKNRFGGTTKTCVAAAYAMINGITNAKVMAFRSGRIGRIVENRDRNLLPNPSVGEVRAFCAGFDKKFMSMIATEQATP